MYELCEWNIDVGAELCYYIECWQEDVMESKIQGMQQYLSFIVYESFIHIII